VNEEEVTVRIGDVAVTVGGVVVDGKGKDKKFGSADAFRCNM